MNGGPASAVRSRVFLAFGAIVVLMIALRFVRAGLAALTFMREGRRAFSSPSTLPSLWIFAAAHTASVALVAGVVAAAIVAVAVGSLHRRPWARSAAFILLAAGALAGLAITALQVLALATEGRPGSAVAEIGYGSPVAGLRIAGAVAALLFALLCGAGIRRLASEEMRREFSADGRAGAGDPPARTRPSL